MNKKWGDKNPPRTTQVNKKIKKEEIGNTVKLTIITRGEVKGEEGGGGDFARNLTELMTSERKKNYWIVNSIYLTLRPPYI